VQQSDGPGPAQDLVQETMIRVQLKWRRHVLPVGHTRRSGLFEALRADDLGRWFADKRRTTIGK
jgi:hypothetical protein